MDHQTFFPSSNQEVILSLDAPSAIALSPPGEEHKIDYYLQYEQLLMSDNQN
jgi:hypothetical protein